MEEIIQKALSKGVELHVAGKFDLAGQLYESVIKLQPDHADANHNIGLLKLDIGAADEALPYLQTALKLDTSIAQFWLSYIKALINLERLDEAGRILDLAKESGIEIEEFMELNQLLNAPTTNAVVVDAEIDTPSQSEANILDSLKLNQVLRLAEKVVKEGDAEEAKRIYKDIVAKFPKNKRAQQGLAASNKPKQPNPTKSPPQDTINQLANFYNQGQLAVVVEQAQALTEQYPEAFKIWNILGAANKGLGRVQAAAEAFKKVTELNSTYADGFSNLGVTLKSQGNLEEAIEAYKKALSLKPDYEKAYYNMGIALQEQNKLAEAIEAYKKALSLKPDYAKAYNNIGATLNEQGKLEEAIESYNKALSLKHDYAEAYNNMGVTLNEQGKLEEAIEVYQKALSLKPDYAEAIENYQNIAVQLLPIITNYGYDFNNNKVQASPEVVHRPKYQVQSLIKAFLEANFSKAHSYNKNFKTCDQKFLGMLNHQDKVFCNAYSSFIGKLLVENWDEEPTSKYKVYHLGESHCLSFAHRNIAIKGKKFTITPRITFGAKAFHFSRTHSDIFKVITKAHFASLPKNSIVFISYGEIDCRHNEGLLYASRKLEKPIGQLIPETVLGYVQWFAEQNAAHGHRLYFINVPAPVYLKEHSADLNSEVAQTVELFNTALKKYSLQYGFDMVDVFRFTAGNDGCSNSLYHLDNRHLGAKALLQIEQQLS